MSEPNTNTNVWENIYNYVEEDNDNFEVFNKDDIDIDMDMLTLDGDNLSTAAINIDNISITTEDITNHDAEILPCDKMAFRKTQKLLKVNDNETEINEDINLEVIDEIFETESIISKFTEEEEIRYQIENNSDSLTSCVILDMIDGKLIHCSDVTLRSLAQLIGTWKIKLDENILTNMKVENKLHTLGVCSSHFYFDQNKLYISNLKQQCSVEKSWVYFHHCLFCSRSKYFFSRNSNCMKHSVCIVGQNNQISCIGLKTCPIFKNINNDNNLQNNIITKSNNDYRLRYICSSCFNSQGGYFLNAKEKKKKFFHVKTTPE